MPDRNSKVVAGMLVIALALMFGAMCLFRPGYLTSDRYLSAFIFIQFLLAAVWGFRTRFFPFLMLGFLWAGMGGIPFSAMWTSGRWFVLIAGAVAGCAIYLHQEHYRFYTFHLVALFCLIAAIVSAMVSSFPKVALLKAVSLLSLFLYASTGARLAAMADQQRLLRSIILSVEILVYFSAVCYFVFHFPVFGNPNSLGATMGVAAVPLLSWKKLTNRDEKRAARITFAFALSVLLLLFSQARAGIIGAVVACAIVCIMTRRYRFLLQAGAGALGLALLALLLVPSHPSADMPTRRAGSSIASVFLYKGKDEQGLWGSRKSAWDETLSVITANPWFGSGFGTTLSTRGKEIGAPSFSSTSLTTREHGDSYLAILEGLGLLGVLPFLTLVIMFAIRALKFLLRMCSTGRLSHVGVPFAMVLVSGFIHAMFEDWLFAVGYYLCVFFWAIAFIFLDLSLPENLDPMPVLQPANPVARPAFLWPSSCDSL